MSWRVGGKIKINVYDDEGNPVCQCHAPEVAAKIVNSVNSFGAYGATVPQLRDELKQAEQDLEHAEALYCDLALALRPFSDLAVAMEAVKITWPRSLDGLLDDCRTARAVLAAHPELRKPE